MESLSLDDQAIDDCQRKSAYGNLYRGAERRFRRVVYMKEEGPRYKDSPVKPGGEGWLLNAQQQLRALF